MINDLMTVLYMLILLAIVFITNTTLGVIIANKKAEFNLKKFLGGIGKGIVIAICMLLFCVTLEIIPSVLGQVGITIQDELITVVEVTLMTFTAYKKYALDCIEKFKTILGVKESE